MENLRIGICGNIGVGKSTLVEAATKHPLDNILLDQFPSRGGDEKVYSFPENFNEEVLDAFYEDPIANAFTAQIEFFNGRLDRQKEIEQCRGIVLEDRTLLEDYHKPYFRWLRVHVPIRLLQQQCSKCRTVFLA